MLGITNNSTYNEKIYRNNKQRWIIKLLQKDI